MSGQCNCEILMSKLIGEEAEKPKQAAMRLAKHRDEIFMRKKGACNTNGKDDLKTDKNQAQGVAAVNLNEAELMCNYSLFSHNSSELTLLKENDQIEI